MQSRKRKRKLHLTKVRTPDINVQLRNGSHRPSYNSIERDLVSEFKDEKQWTDQCTEVLSSNLAALYNYDGLNNCMSRAYGHHKYIVLINPKMVLCYHPSCLSKGEAVVTLKHIFEISSYVIHLKTHNTDEIGRAMERRFKAVVENNFITDEELDKLAKSPYILQPNIRLPKKVGLLLEKYGILRDFSGTYTCAWKDRMIAAGIIKQSSLSYQEDEALIHSLLHFPNPVRSWLRWPTLSLYAMKLFSSIGSSALNLYRGLMRTRITKKTAANVKEFYKEINHPCMSVSTTQGYLPALNYDSQIEHKSEIIFHLKLLLKNEDVPCVLFTQAKRFLSTEVIDEQELNQGTFVDNGRLYGLKNPMTADEVRKVGLEKLSEYIATKNPFITNVREYRQTDSGGLMCSNTFTSFECGAMNAEKCKEQLNDVRKLANSCLSCLTNNVECEYSRVDEPCENCCSSGMLCVSMVVIHVLWDMGSSHKRCKTISPHIELTSSDSDFFNSKLFTIGFGGLHLAKAVTNALRNHILTHKGMNYGMNIFRAIKKQSTSLENVKQAVFIAKDRQSDLLSFLTTGPLVQKALKELGNYHVRRVPEPYLTYKKNAKTQKKIVSPVGLATNCNGDVFVLDAQNACVHVVDRCVVSRVFFIGKYQAPSLQQYGHSQDAVTASDVKLSSKLKDIVSYQDNIYILDQGREEIIIVCNVITAKSTPTRKVHILSIKALSMTHNDSQLILLMEGEEGNLIKIINPIFPDPDDYQLKIKYKTVLSWSPDFALKDIFIIGKELLGAVNTDGIICTYQLSSKKITNEKSFDITSDGKPCVSADNHLYVLKNGHVQKYTFKYSKKENQLQSNFVEEIVSDEVKSIHCWKTVLFLVRKVTSFSHSLEEIGSLDFGFEISEAINGFYDAIDYTKPGHGAVVEKATLNECIDKAMPLVNILKSMTKSLRSQFNSRTTFLGEFGSPWTTTINCTIDTVDSWKALVRRLDALDPSLSSKVYPHSVTNEAWIEHSFGFNKKAGQGHSQNCKEYVQSKRRVAMDFAIRTTDAPFCQYCKVKVRDKGYQSLVNVGKTKLSVQEIMEIFKPTRTKTIAELHVEENEISEEDQLLLHKSYLFTKSVRRQSTRTKWAEASGYQPNLLDEHDVNHQIIAGDLVFSRGVEDELLFFVVKETVQLDGKVDTVKVCEAGKSEKKRITFSKLLLDRGLIAVVPAKLYKITKDQVVFDELAQDLIDSFENSEPTEERSEEEWSMLMESDPNPQVDSVTTCALHQNAGSSSSNAPMELDIFEEEQPLLKRCTKKRKILDDEEEDGIGSEDDLLDINNDDVANDSGDDSDFGYPKEQVEDQPLKKRRRIRDDSDEEEDTEVSFMKHEASCDDWVAVIYEGNAFFEQVLAINATHGYQVKTLTNERTNFFKWSDERENIWYRRIEFLADPPSPANNRGAYKFTEVDFERLNNLMPL